MKTLNNHTPEWLKALPAGEYTLTELVKISGAHKATVSRLLRDYGAERRYEPIPNSHLTNLVFVWPGLETRYSSITEGIRV